MTTDTPPPKPSRLSLWMDKHGRPHQLTVEYRAAGTDTAETWIVLAANASMTIEIRPGELARDRYGLGHDGDTYLKLDHAFCVDWTEEGRKRLAAWRAFQKREAHDIAEFDRLKKKFGEDSR